MIYASAFDGIGAVHAAWRPLGWRCAWTSEIEPSACAVTDARWGDKNLGDATRITKEMANAEGPLDLLAGGTPCQSFSVAGHRRGLDDARGNLALVFLRLGSLARPRWIVWENVPGVLSAQKGRAFGSVLGALAELGYGFAWRVLDAQFFGVPQRRRRVFVVGYLGDWRPAAAVLFERESLCGNPAPRRKARAQVTGTLSSRTAAGGGLGTDFETQGGLIPILEHGIYQCHGSNIGPMGTLRRGGGNVTSGVPFVLAHGQANSEIAEDGCPTLNCNHEQPIVFDCKSDARGSVGEISPTLRSMNAAGGRGNGGGQVAVAFRAAGQEGLVPGPMAPPIAATDGGGAGPPTIMDKGFAVRRLTPRECERLQGFPDDYTLVEHRGKPMSDSARYRLLGNSMAVPVMHWLGRRIDFVDWRDCSRGTGATTSQRGRASGFARLVCSSCFAGCRVGWRSGSRTRATGDSARRRRAASATR